MATKSIYPTLKGFSSYKELKVFNNPNYSFSDKPIVKKEKLSLLQQ